MSWQDEILDRLEGVDVPYSVTLTVKGADARIIAGVINQTGLSVRDWMRRQVAAHVAKETGAPFLEVLAGISSGDDAIGVSGRDCPHPGCDGAHLVD